MGAIKLEKAFFFNLTKGGDAIPVMYNPEKVVINKAISWKDEKKKKKQKDELPTVQWDGGKGRSLKVDLHFDSSGPPMADGLPTEAPTIEDQIKKIVDLTTLAEGDKGHPPLVYFGWGNAQEMKLEGVIKTVNVTYTRFNPDGIPTRAQVSVEVLEAPPFGGESATSATKPEAVDVRTERLEAGRGGGA